MTEEYLEIKKTEKFQSDLYQAILRNPKGFQHLTNRFQKISDKREKDLEEELPNPAERALFKAFCIGASDQPKLEQKPVGNLLDLLEPAQGNNWKMITGDSEPCSIPAPIVGLGGLQEYLCNAWGVKY
jgi:hypothetical protein